jgi:hypothetical protein
MEKKFKIKDFESEFQKRIPNPSDFSPEEIKEAAKQIAEKMNMKVEVDVTVEIHCCPISVKVTVVVHFH